MSGTESHEAAEKATDTDPVGQLSLADGVTPDQK